MERFFFPLARSKKTEERGDFFARSLRSLEGDEEIASTLRCRFARRRTIESFFAPLSLRSKETKRQLLRSLRSLEAKKTQKTHQPIRFRSRSTHSCEWPASIDTIRNSGSLWSANHLGVSAIVLPWKINVFAKLCCPR